MNIICATENQIFNDIIRRLALQNDSYCDISPMSDIDWHLSDNYSICVNVIKQVSNEEYEKTRDLLILAGAAIKQDPISSDSYALNLLGLQEEIVAFPFDNGNDDEKSTYEYITQEMIAEILKGFYSNKLPIKPSEMLGL